MALSDATMGFRRTDMAHPLLAQRHPGGVVCLDNMTATVSCRAVAASSSNVGAWHHFAF